MRIVVQRVSSARVEIAGETAGAIGEGIVALIAVSPTDADAEARWAADKIANLRIFNDDDGKMNRSLLDVGGAALVISQFTLYGDARKGRRPSFVGAAQGGDAETLYLRTVEELRGLGIRVETGEFGAAMSVSLTNEGPVTILLDSDKAF